MNHKTLQQKLHALASFPHVYADTVNQFGKVLKGLNDWELLRINPLQFASAHGFAVSEMIDLFIHGAKVGLFDFSWNMLCPACGGLVRSHYSVNEVEAEMFHCAICDVDVPSNLDAQVEVAFTINPSVKKIDIEPFKDLESYRRYFFSPNFQRSEALTDYVDEALRASAFIGPDEAQQISFIAEPGQLYRLLSIENNIACFLQATGSESTATQMINIDLLPTGFSPEQVSINAGHVTLNVRNLRKSHVGFILVLTDFERMYTIVEEHPPTMLPFFTGKMLLNNQSFRDLFRAQHLVPGLKLPLRSLTVLFTDLKGSTALYDKTGDAFAYSLVQEHYRRLAGSVREHSGAVIKTMGDAIMATFSDPYSAARAAIDMMVRIQSMNAGRETTEHELGLKIGLHEGAALAIDADDRLDYFGQTVNIAARVQGLAQAGEIWLTEPVFQADGVQHAFMDNGYHEAQHLVSLKGVGQPALVYQYRASQK